jgi:DNA-binding IclR family transcriptional regulator
MERRNRDAHPLSSVTNALRVLQSFSLEQPEKNVTTLAAELKLGKSTVSRLLSTLASADFVHKNADTRKYALGLSVLGLNTVLTSRLEINRESLPVLQQLVASIDETAHLASLAGTDVVYLSIVPCQHPVRTLSHIGRRNPLHCTSSGKAMLAFQDAGLIEQFIGRGLKAFTPSTITDPAVLRAALQDIRERGYATSVEEIRAGIASVAAPIRDYSGRVGHALTVIGPVGRLDPTDERIVRKVKAAAREISHRLGCFV